MNYLARRSELRTLAARFLSLALMITMMLIGASSAALAQQTSSQFVTGLPTPQGGLVLSGTAINPATGNPFRHLWTADAVNGLCRIDPDVDTPAAQSINHATCVSTVAGAAFSAGQLTFDSASNTIYAVDGGGKLGIFVLHLLPGADGEGQVDQANTSVLGPTCGIAVNQPNATSLGPDGNLYVGFRRSGNIMRINSPTTSPLPCANVQATVITTGDRLTNQMAWIGHTLFINLTKSTDKVDSADSCLTAQNVNTCVATFLGIVIPGATATTMLSDQAAGQANGDDLYFADGISTVSAMLGITLNALGQPNLSSPTQVGGTGAFFSNVGALAVDASDPTNHVLYVADDPTAGLVAGNGRWWQVLSAPPAPAPPSAPSNVIATAGNASASLSWTAPNNHQPVTSYTVHNSLASNGLPVADITLTGPAGSTAAPAAAANITGLVNGVTYQFEVQAANAQGSSPFSAPSNSVTPQAPTVPGQPTNVTATAGDSFATVSWTAPASDGGSPITSYTVTAFTGGAPAGITALANGNSATLFPLTNGVAYTFSVHATNAIGDGPESLQSAPVTPAAPAVAAVSVSMTGTPSAVVSNGSVVYTVTVANSGTITAPAVTVADIAFSATVSSVATTQGACTVAGTNINCNLGNVAVGASVNITVTLKPAAGVTQMQNGATATPSGGASSSALVTTPVIPLSQTTDVQVIGAAQNGGPAVTGTDIFTWQIHNAQTLAANSVHFTTTLAPGMVFQSFSNNLGATCSVPAAGTAGATIACDLATLAGSQTMIVTVNVTFNATGTMSTTAQATFNGTDNNPANNSASITVGVK